MKTTEIRKKIGDIIIRMAVAHNGDIHALGVSNWFKNMQTIMDEAERLSDSVGPGLRVGKLVSWGVADGAAFYFVTGVRKDVCTLAHLNWVDSWQSPVVCRGVALRCAVQDAVTRHDGLKTISIASHLPWANYNDWSSKVGRPELRQ